MGIVTVVGASKSVVQVTVDGGTNQLLAQQYADAIKAASNSGDLYTVPLTAGNDTLSGSSSSYNQGEIINSGDYTLTGGYNNIVMGALAEGDTAVDPLSANIILNAAGGASTINVLDGNTGATTINFGNQSGSLIATAGHNHFAFGEGDWKISTGFDSSNLVNLGSGNNSVISEGHDTILGSTGMDTVTIIGGSDFIALHDNAAVVDLGISGSTIYVGSNSTIYGGDKSTDIFTGNTGTVVGSISDTISAAGNLQVIHGDANDISVSGALSFLNGTGHTTITAGSSTIFGANGLDAIIDAVSSTSLFVANEGSETVDGSHSKLGFQAFADYGSAITMIGSSESDSLVGGTGNATMTGGSGAGNLFAITDGLAGGSYTITDFGSAAGNIMALYDYGLQNNNGLQSVLNSATISGGNSTIELSDHSKITFVGVTDLKASDFNLS